MSTRRRSHPAPTEKVVQQTVIGLFRALGTFVGSTSQYRKSGQAVGLPDLVCQHEGAGVGWWWETKAPFRRWRDHDTDPWTEYSPLDRRTWRSKPLEPEQEKFRRRALACGQLHGWGGLVEAEDFLVEQGLAQRLASGLIQLRSRPLVRGAA